MKFKNEDKVKTKKPFRVIGGITVKYYGEEYTAFETGGKEFKVKGGAILKAFKQAEAYKRSLDKGRSNKAKLHRGKRQAVTSKRSLAVTKAKKVSHDRVKRR